MSSCGKSCSTRKSDCPVAELGVTQPGLKDRMGGTGGAERRVGPDPGFDPFDHGVEVGAGLRGRYFHRPEKDFEGDKMGDFADLGERHRPGCLMFVGEPHPDETAGAAASQSHRLHRRRLPVQVRVDAVQKGAGGRGESVDEGLADGGAAHIGTRL